MVRISKLTDYGVLIMAYMAHEVKKIPHFTGSIAGSGNCSSGTRLFQAREIASETDIGHATVSKLLKILAKNKLLLSHRGVNGGYSLLRTPESISVADLIQALEGPLAITECNLGHNSCPTQSHCAIKAPWQHINRVITEALSSVKLSDLAYSTHFGNTVLGNSTLGNTSLEKAAENTVFANTTLKNTALGNITLPPKLHDSDHFLLKIGMKKTRNETNGLGV